MPRRCVSAPASVHDPHHSQLPRGSGAVVAQPGEARQLLAGFHGRAGGLVGHVRRARLPFNSLASFGKRRILDGLV